MKKMLILSATWFLATLGSAQQLTLTNGIATKTFPERSVFKIISGGDDPSRSKTFCDYLEADGTFHRVSSDSLHLLLTSLMSRNILDGGDHSRTLLFTDIQPSYPIALGDIYQLKRYRSVTSMKRKRNMGIAGGILIFTGAVTSLNYLLVKGKSNKQAVLASGGLQFWLGVGLAIGSSPKSYYFKGRTNNWKVDTP